MTDSVEDDAPVARPPIPEPIDKGALLASSCLKSFDPNNTEAIPEECACMVANAGDPDDGVVHYTIVIDFSKSKPRTP